MNTTKNERLESSCPEPQGSGTVSVPVATSLAPDASFVGGDMKYTILINQIGIADAGLIGKIDLVDTVILDYLNCWSTSPKRKIGAFEGEEYFWVNFNHLIEEIPILGIREKSRLSERFKKLRTLGLIKSFQYKDNTLYVRLLCGDMFFAKKRGVLRQTEQAVTPSVTGGVTPDVTAQASNQIKPLSKSNNTPPTPPERGDRVSILKAHAQCMGINSEIFWPIWERWIRCKQGKKFKNLESETAGITHLSNLCGKDVEVAKQIVEQSIANNWQGLFMLKASTADGGIRMNLPSPEDPMDKPYPVTCKTCKRSFKMTKRLWSASTFNQTGECQECYDKPRE